MNLEPYAPKFGRRSSTAMKSTFFAPAGGGTGGGVGAGVDALVHMETKVWGDDDTSYPWLPCFVLHSASDEDLVSTDHALHVGWEAHFAQHCALLMPDVTDSTVHPGGLHSVPTKRVGPEHDGGDATAIDTSSLLSISIPIPGFQIYHSG